MRTPSLPLPSLVLLSSAIGLIVSASAIAADPVYKWKDSSGQSHYSQSPPQGQKYETIMPTGVTPTDTSASASAPAPATSIRLAASAKTPAMQAFRQKNCEAARSNVAVLASHPTADIDAKGTGKPARVTPAQRSAEVDRANQQVTLYCGQ
jgi:hypothetical protein